MSANAQKAKQLDVLYDWRGSNCQFKADRPFFLITDIHELERFWNKSNCEESMPWIDFDKTMLFVWVPGSGMFDHDKVEVEQFVFKNNKYYILMNMKRKDSGGFWRKPFVATLLPRVTKGDIFILRRGNKDAGERAWMPVYTLWDMQGHRKVAFGKIEYEEEVVQKPQFITHRPAKTVRQRVAKQPPAIRKPATKVAQARPVSRPKPVAAPRPVKRPVVSKPRLVLARPRPKKSSGWSDENKNVVPPTGSTFKEDELFGSEFDIKF